MNVKEETTEDRPIPVLVYHDGVQKVGNLLDIVFGFAIVRLEGDSIPRRFSHEDITYLIPDDRSKFSSILYEIINEFKARVSFMGKSNRTTFIEKWLDKVIQVGESEGDYYVRFLDFTLYNTAFEENAIKHSNWFRQKVLDSFSVHKL